jgi:16S rRNA (cytidine1402-2'-O)-methyltransferase
MSSSDPRSTYSRGRLLVVSTPIGNLGDLSPRAREALESADVIACEDTRHTGMLLARLGATKGRLVSLHEHNERQRLPGLLAALADGRTVAMVSDAGTPLLSDPGFLLVREAAAAGARVEAVPGASALLAALVVSGLPPLPFTFAGFPPQRPGKRRSFYRRLGSLEHTLVVYESPHRLAKSLADAAGELGPRQAVIGRELTKLHEEVLRGTLPELAAEVTRRGGVKGEAVLVIAPAAEPSAEDATDSDGDGEGDGGDGDAPRRQPSRRRGR